MIDLIQAVCFIFAWCFWVVSCFLGLNKFRLWLADRFFDSMIAEIVGWTACLGGLFSALAIGSFVTAWIVGPSS